MIPIQAEETIHLAGINRYARKGTGVATRAGVQPARHGSRPWGANDPPAGLQGDLLHEPTSNQEVIRRPESGLATKHFHHHVDGFSCRLQLHHGVLERWPLRQDHR